MFVVPPLTIEVGDVRYVLVDLRAEDDSWNIELTFLSSETRLFNRLLDLFFYLLDLPHELVVLDHLRGVWGGGGAQWVSLQCTWCGLPRDFCVS